ncbi:hypothetical protein B566_EDAN008100 [Ephemera danica]|nr:hypothetical protein B566_EDAN008100 [Ephemera danica]
MSCKGLAGAAKRGNTRTDSESKRPDYLKCSYTTMWLRGLAALALLSLVTWRPVRTQEASNLFTCPNGWEMRGLHCYKFFSIRHSWDKAAEICRRYGSHLVLVESFEENNVTSALAARGLSSAGPSPQYWLGLASLDDLRTNTLEAAAGLLVSQYSGFWSLKQPDSKSGECVDVTLTDDAQSWELTTCESLLPFMCRAHACPAGSFHCSNGRCVNSAFKCDKTDDCGDGSDELDCPSLCRHYSASGGDVLESPGYPHKYSALADCKWTLEGPSGHNILLQFQDFETEKGFDTVTVLAGGRTEREAAPLATLSGKQDLGNKLFISASNFMVVKFSSDASVERKGFSILENGATVLSRESEGNVSTSGSYVTWISTELRGRAGIEDLDLEARRDIITIRDGSSPRDLSLVELTGTKQDNPNLIMSTGNQLYVYFRSVLGDSRRGFNIKYSEGCRATLNAANGTITSPAFGHATYPSNQECLYTIKRPGGGALSLKFDDFELHKSDIVQVFDGSTTSGLRLHAGEGFSASSKPRITLTATSGAMLIRFVTDALHGSRGWSTSFSADCPALKPGEGALASNRDTAFGTVVTFTCPRGQEFATGQPRLTTECLPGGEWSISYIPKCQEVYCGPVPQIDNGFSIGSTNVTYRGQATYQCYAGFAFPAGQPVEQVSCAADGRWEKLPTCLASQCPALPDLAHGNATILNGGGRSYGTIIRFECHSGFVRSGPPVVLCMSNGTWSGEVPVCTHVNECASSGCDLASTECVNTPGAFNCKCRRGFAPSLDCRPVGDLGLSTGGIPDEAISVSSSERGYDKEKLRLTSPGGWCGANPEPGSNWVMLDMKAPTVLRGFRTQSVARADGNLAFTSAVRIQYTNNLTDVFRDYTNPDGTPVEFRILEPTLSVLNLPLPIEAQYIRFRIQDYKGAPCLKLEVMGCTRLECVDINECAVNNGGCDQKCINSPGNFTCVCNVGFELFRTNGTAGFAVANSESGERDGDIFQRNKTCVPVQCSPLKSPENGLLLATKEKYHFGDLVHFQCNFGYVMVGASSLLCTSGGVWNGSEPECQYAKCTALPDDRSEGLSVARADTENVLIPFRENVTLTCGSTGRLLRKSATSSFRQCSYDPNPGIPDYWLSGLPPSCPRVDCGNPLPTPGAEYGQFKDTRYQSSFFFGCQDTFKLAGQTSNNDNVVRCQANGVWDFGDLRCEGPVCEDPGRPADGFQIARSYEQGSEVEFSCTRPGYILINPRPITCLREPECRVVKPLGLASGRIPDSAINATSERPNYEAKNVRLNSVTGWCGKQEAFTYVSVDMGQVYRVKAILVKGVVTNDIVGRPTEIRFFYKQAESENYVVYFPNFNLTMRDPGNYGELAMITLPKYVQARFVILGIVSYMDNACLKFELMGCEEPAEEPLLGYDYGYSPCVDNEPPVFQNCPQQPVVVQKGPNGLLPVNFTEPIAIDNSGSIARLEIKPVGFHTPVTVFQDKVVKYVAFDYDGNVAICEINITVPDDTPPFLSCPQSYVIELVDKQDSYVVNFNETRRKVNTSDASGDVTVTFVPERANIPIGGFENVTVIAADKYGNQATCHFQVAVQATPCVDWELKAPANGALNCLPGDKGLQCIATCNQGFRFTDGNPVKTFSCEEKSKWTPTAVVPDCVSEDTQQADYHVIAAVNYRANGAVAPLCLAQYADLMAQYYTGLNSVLTQRCSAVNVNMNVSFVDTRPQLLEENVVQMDFVLGVVPAVRQPQLYDLCGSTLNLIFDLSVPYASAVIEPLLNVSAIGNQCPPLRALRSKISRGFECGVGEVLNMDTNDVPRCLHCPAGTFAGEKQKTCTPCARGFYQSRDRQGACERCPMGSYTREEGSKGAGACVPVCGFGTYSPTGLVPCLECPRHSYTGEPPTSGFKDCQACPANTFTYQPAAPGPDYCRAKCSPGSYSDTGLAPCAQCPRHFFQAASGQTSCSECPSDMQTRGLGASGREECVPTQCGETACQHGGLCVPMGHDIQCFCPAGFSGRRCEIDIDECASQPCFNGGTCQDLPQGYRCQCPQGYTGLNCQEERSDCRNDTCAERAMCKDEPGINNYTCLCRVGYTGLDCDITIDPCTAEGNPCSNGASCVALKQGRFRCECLPGWEGQKCEINTGFTGKRCQEKVDLCADNPCQNGVCVDRLYSHQCICLPGWSGAACEVNVDECASSPCRNGGQCEDLVNDFRCICEPGFTGSRCQHEIDHCSSLPCQHGGSCDNTRDGFTCRCRPGFVGLQCEAEIDECLSDPCNPEGSERCVDLDNKFMCQCREGYQGTFCEVNNNDCASQPCLNGGSCRDDVGKFECTCPPGWSGQRCETDIGACTQRPCPSGTDGKHCETAPERCIGNPCMHGGKCQDFGSGLNCTCPEDFAGVGCQYEFDACAAGVCKNGATCMDNGPGYMCTCAAGFTGKHCEQDIIDCQENSSVQVDYDMYFPEPERSTASLVVPFYTGAGPSLTVAMWVKFAQRDEGGVFFTMYSVSSPHVPTDRRVMLQAHSSGVQVSLFRELPDAFLSFREYATVNDGQWHHVAIVWDGNTGTLTLITEGLIASKLEDYGGGRMLPEYAWVTLGRPAADVKAYADNGFHGHLTRVQKQVRDCRLEPVLYRGLALTWSGFEDTDGGVERVVPSRCGERVCPPGYTGPRCEQLQQDKIAPMVDYCPGDIWVVARNGSSVVSWDEPVFSDNVGVVRVAEQNNHRPGLTLLWGTYHIAYAAYDATGNSATCAFKVYVLAEFCPELADPIGGSQTCRDWGSGGQFKVCEISCAAGSRFSEPVPRFYTCGAEGFWRPTRTPGQILVYPACSASRPAQRVFKVAMQFPSSVLCNEAGQGVLRQRVRNAINTLNRRWNVCSFHVEGTRECKDLNIDVKCDHRVRQTRQASEAGGTYVVEVSVPVEKSNNSPRVARQASPSDTYHVEISFPAANDPVVNADSQERSTIERLLQKLILEDDQFDVRDILPNTLPDPASLALDSDYACPAGQVVVAPDCVPCAVGSYYERESKQCVKCPVGTYQSEAGQLQCSQCPNIAGRTGVTSAPGARSAADCKGHAVQRECRDECASGLQLGHDSRCEPCPRGTFRSQGRHAACQSCPPGRTTPKNGAATIEECSLPVCQAGTYLNGTLNNCIACRKGTYQPDAQQTTCIPCPPNTSTQGTGSVNVCAGFCENEGVCVKDNRGQPTCRCIGSFTGRHCSTKSEFAYIAGGIAGVVIFIIIIVLLVWMICVRSSHRREPKKMMTPSAGDQTGSQVNFYYGAPAPYAESIAPSHHSTYAHYYDDEEDGWEMPNFYNETYMKESLHNGGKGGGNGNLNSLARSNASLYGTKDDLYDRLKRHAYPTKKESLHNGGKGGGNGNLNSLARSNASLYGTKDDLYDRLKRHAYPTKKDKSDSDSEGQ